jgi:DNA-binding NtrC family response regulator
MQRDGHYGNGGDDGSIPPAPPINPFIQRNTVFTTLVVDSAANFNGHLEDFLKTEGHYILRAETAKEALAMTRQHWPDLILLNKEMDGTNGLKFFPELLTEHPSAAVIMMANQPGVSSVVDAMLLGAIDYLDRPLDTRRLKRTIDSQKKLYDLL